MTQYSHTDTQINLTPGRRVLIEKLTVPQAVKNFPLILRNPILSCPYAPATFPYPESEQSATQSATLFLKD